MKITIFKKRYRFWLNYRRIKFIIKELRCNNTVMNDILVSDKDSRRFIKNIYGSKKVKQMQLEIIKDRKKIEKDFEQLYKALDSIKRSNKNDT